MSDTSTNGTDLGEGMVLNVPRGPAGVHDHRWRIEEIDGDDVYISVKEGRSFSWAREDDPLSLSDIEVDINEDRISILRSVDTDTE